MKIVLVTMLSVVNFTSALGGQNAPSQIPESAVLLFKTTGLDKRFDFSTQLNPTFLRGDFDGDGKPDVAILIKQKSGGKVGIGVCHSSTNKIVVIGAGTNLGNGGDNFDWIDIWKTTAKAAAIKQLGKTRSRLLKGDAIHVEKSESASALIYWNGTRYVWQQQGD